MVVIKGDMYQFHLISPVLRFMVSMCDPDLHTIAAWNEYENKGSRYQFVKSELQCPPNNSRGQSLWRESLHHGKHQGLDAAATEDHKVGTDQQKVMDGTRRYPAIVQDDFLERALE